MAYISLFCDDTSLKDIVQRIQCAYPDPAVKSHTEILGIRLLRTKRETDKDKLFEQEIGVYNVCLWLKDTLGIVAYANQASCDLIFNTKVKPVFLKNDDFSGNTLAQLCAEGDIRVLAEQRSIRWIESAVYPAGNAIWLDVLKSLWKDNNDIIQGTIGSAVDILGIVPGRIKREYREPQSIEIPLNVCLNGEIIEKLVNKKNGEVNHGRKTI